MANIQDKSGIGHSHSDKNTYSPPEDSNINRFMLDCLPFNDVSFKQGPKKFVADLSGYTKQHTDNSGKLKSISDKSGSAKVVSDDTISSIYTYGDSRITYGDNNTMGGYPL